MSSRQSASQSIAVRGSIVTKTAEEIKKEADDEIHRRQIEFLGHEMVAKNAEYDRGLKFLTEIGLPYASPTEITRMRILYMFMLTAYTVILGAIVVLLIQGKGSKLNAGYVFGTTYQPGVFSTKVEAQTTIVQHGIVPVYVAISWGGYIIMLFINSRISDGFVQIGWNPVTTIASALRVCLIVTQLALIARIADVEKITLLLFISLLAAAIDMTSLAMAHGRDILEQLTTHHVKVMRDIGSPPGGPVAESSVSSEYSESMSLSDIAVDGMLLAPVGTPSPTPKIAAESVTRSSVTEKVRLLGKAMTTKRMSIVDQKEADEKAAKKAAIEKAKTAMPFDDIVSSIDEMIAFVRDPKPEIAKMYAAKSTDVITRFTYGLQALSLLVWVIVWIILWTNLAWQQDNTSDMPTYAVPVMLAICLLSVLHKVYTVMLLSHSKHATGSPFVREVVISVGQLAAVCILAFVGL